MKTPSPPTDRRFPLSRLRLIPLLLLLPSCGSSSSDSLTASSWSKVSQLWPSRVDVVEVRHKDLKNLTSGKDRALAWNRSLNQWVYVPVDYKPPTLPDGNDFPMDAGLLPPLPPGQAPSADMRGEQPSE